MIPKVIHYCWFGRNPLPESAVKCINSWRKHFPDYEIKEWNEDNFDVNIIQYTKEAYEAKKYAFVSDYARMWILYHFGGLYFDTDVEVIKPMDDIVERGPFMGIEDESNLSVHPFVNPGLGLGANPGLPLLKEILDYYEDMHFLLEGNTHNMFAIVKITTDVLCKHGIESSNNIQNVASVWIYPSDYFNPFDNNTGKLIVTNNTRSIHWYSKTWMRKQNPLRTWLVRRIHRYFGNDSLAWLKKLFRS